MSPASEAGAGKFASGASFRASAMYAFHVRAGMVPPYTGFTPLMLRSGFSRLSEYPIHTAVDRAGV
jgi:hypothetical protein